MTQPTTRGRTALAATAGILLVLCTGCGPVRGYPGADRPASETATLRANPFWSGILATVRAVDGYEVNSQIDLAVLAGERTLTLELGPVSLQSLQQAGRQTQQMLAMTNAEWKTTTTVTTTFEAGVEYAISGDWSQPDYTVEIQRYDDRSVVDSVEVTGTKGEY